MEISCTIPNKTTVLKQTSKSSIFKCVICILSMLPHQSQHNLVNSCRRSYSKIASAAASAGESGAAMLYSAELFKA